MAASVLFVCAGNICRSPTAEGVFRRFLTIAGVAQWVSVDSAGTNGYHDGAPPDPRSVSAAARRGYDLSKLRARRVIDVDFARFDYLLAMDRTNLEYLQKKCPEAHLPKLRLLLDYAPSATHREVPDPYYGGPEGFEVVLDLVEEGAEGLLDHLREAHGW